MDIKQLLRKLPQVDELLRHAKLKDDLERHPRYFLLEAIREALQKTREQILEGRVEDYKEETLIERVRVLLVDGTRPSLRPVINATGVVIHTNLGRSLCSAAATAAVNEIATSYSTLEYDVRSGSRGSRKVHYEKLVRGLTGAEAALAVNNNAAAVMLVLATLARGKEVVVSRGELVEIGGSFRIPDIMRESGATMVEVGTTNKTRLRDYESAITERTALILKVHASNFRVVGFTEEVGVGELAKLGSSHGIPVFEDQGSGVLMDLRTFGLPPEPTIRESIEAGAALVSCSGDKLLGGPQAGIIAGRSELIERLEHHPLARAFRLDKLTIAALEATLKAYVDPEIARSELPTLRMLTATSAEMATQARKLADRIVDACGETAEVDIVEEISRSGGGSLPMADIPTTVVRLLPRTLDVVELERRLRLGDPCVVARIRDDRLLFDPRTLSREDENQVVRLIAENLRG